MERNKQNPYTDLGLTELAQACNQRAGELMDRGIQRTPGERAELAESTAFLLLALARAIDPGDFAADSPRRDLGGRVEGMARAFAQWHEGEVRRLRYRTMVRAADYAIGGDAWPWMRTLQLGGKDVSEIALKSEKELLLVLQLFESTSPRRPKYPG